MGWFLLLPEDERALVAHLLQAESLERLAHDDLAYGPQVAGALDRPPALPEPPRPGVEPAEPVRITFWVPALGELRARPDGFVDHERSPVLSWHRTRWHPSGALCPGELRTQSRPRKDQPVELLRLLARVERWMKGEGVKLYGPSPLWALRHAASWVGGGGAVWPGNPRASM